MKNAISDFHCSFLFAMVVTLQGGVCERDGAALCHTSPHCQLCMFSWYDNVL